MFLAKKTKEDAEDQDIFDINDFTTASDWERFVVQIEELINEWKLNTDDVHAGTEDSDDSDVNFENGEWQEKFETLVFADEIPFTISYFYLCSRSRTHSSTSTSACVREPSTTTAASKTTATVAAAVGEPPTYDSYEKLQAFDFDSVSSITAAESVRAGSREHAPSTLETHKQNNLPPKSMADLLNKSNDFLVNYNNLTITPPIAYWYGLCRYVVIKPTRANNIIDSETRSNVILSSVSTAINNTCCLIPVFVQVNFPHREMFVGICEGSALKTHFQIIHFNYVPVQYAYLPGLIEVFKSKLIIACNLESRNVHPVEGTHLSNSAPLISVSIRFTYLIEESTFLDWNRSLDKQVHTRKHLDWQRNAGGATHDDNINCPSFKCLPFGSVQDCIETIYLTCVWPNLSEDIVVDSDTYSDLNPQQSNDWSLTINNIMDKCDLRLTALLLNYIQVLEKTASPNQLLGSLVSVGSSRSAAAGGGDSAAAAATGAGVTVAGNNETATTSEEIYANSLRKLTTPKITSRGGFDQVYNLSTNMMDMATNKMKGLQVADSEVLPLDKDVLDCALNYIFPDANPPAKVLASSQSTGTLADAASRATPDMRYFLKRLNLAKSSSSDNAGLLNRLVTCLAVANEMGRAKAIAQLWKEFLLELRFRYESCILVPDVSDMAADANSYAAPDLSRCLLHQKVQMLNCCIRKRQERKIAEMSSLSATTKQQEGGTSNTAGNNSNSSNNDDNDEEQFFDCEDEQAETDKGDQPTRLVTKQTAEGRLKRFHNLTLLKNKSEPIYVPITQESTPMTEDMLEQHASILVNLGCSDDAALLRAKIQSASLMSDMQSFKAANPESVLEDFVRWYSPRDWVEYEEKQIDPATNEEKLTKRFDLSHRMKIPGNVWLDVWNKANPIPVKRQKRLFDDTKEAENVFLWLNSLNMSQVIEQTLPILFSASLFTCYQEAHSLDITAFVSPIVEILVDKLIKITRNNETKKYLDLVNYIKSIEQLVSLMKSLVSKFSVHKRVKQPTTDGTLNMGDDNDADASELKRFLKEILKSSSAHVMCEVKINNGAHSTVGKLITRLCKQHGESADTGDHHQQSSCYNQLISFDKPCKREYILRSSTPRPAPYSRQSPQKMYCLLAPNEFRLAGAFTEDTMFF